LIPKDHKDFKEGVIDEQLLFDIINGRQNKILAFDFSEKEQEYEYLMGILHNRFQELADKYGEKISTEEERK
jgi:uncharacterized protein YsxB (DUF464 family)